MHLLVVVSGARTNRSPYELPFFLVHEINTKKKHQARASVGFSSKLQQHCYCSPIYSIVRSAITYSGLVVLVTPLNLIQVPGMTHTYIAARSRGVWTGAEGGADGVTAVVSPNSKTGCFIPDIWYLELMATCLSHPPRADFSNVFKVFFVRKKSPR